MRAAIYNPYLDTLGGGEKYTLSFASALRDFGYKVDVEWKTPGILRELSKRFAMDLSGIEVRESVKRGEGYDLSFWVSDGSIPTLFGRNNFLHFQVPFVNVNGNTLLNRMKLIRIKKVICNSEFTKRFIDSEYGVKSLVVYPPIDVGVIKSAVHKENLILYVGRFSRLMQSKGQDVLIEVFKKLLLTKVGRWRMVLAGGVEVGVGDYVTSLRKKASGFPIEIVESPKVEKIRSLYSKSKIYWSASGFGIDENKFPQKVEHFGITVVEAMAGGVVPLCYNAGGHKEIIQNSVNGFLWNDKKELYTITHDLIKNDDKLRKIAIGSQTKAQQFAYEKFASIVKNII